MTAIDVAALATLPVVGPGAPPAELRRAMDEAGSSWAAVVDDDGKLVGAVARADADNGAVVDGGPKPPPGVVPTDASLKDAFAQLLLNDAGWVAVTDEGRYRGVLTVEVLHAAIRRSVSEGDPR